ncbi:MAG: transporter [Oscillospiraceae bacterium]|nr:transporter [Oscillospiraceae bacterium]
MRLLKNRYFQLLGAFFLFSFVGVVGKMAAMSGGLTMRFFLFVGLQVFLLGLYAIIWQQVLKKFDLVAAMAYRGVVVILSLIWAIVFFQEEITMFNIIGSLIIVAGIYIVSTGEV